MDWLPIETAPKDGTNILIIDMTAEAPEAALAHFSEYWWGCKNFERSEFEEENIGCGTSVLEFVGYYDPTHWMPLPPPPEQNK